MELIALASLLGLSVAANVGLGIYIASFKRRAPLSKSAEELLHDMTRGQALIRVTRVDPDDVFLRSPRT